MYPSDLRDKDWALIAHHFGVGKCGNRAMHSRRRPCEWHFIRGENGVSVAHVTEGFSTVENGLWVF